MKRFRLIDNSLGWLMFAIAAVVYCSTIEPTASFWDCPEFISTASKLEVGHPPGAPFFMLTGNFFSQFASDASHIAMMVNMMNALLSALCIMFLFWTITHLARKLILKDWDDLSLSKLIAIEASGAVGALIYCFSDTFWYSAVEGEVYAYSSLFTAVVFWLILKWEDHADEPHSDRWLLLIAYMTGLSIGVHLLNLLCIPAIVLVFVYKKFPDIETKGSLLALAVSFIIIAGVLYGLMPGIVKVGGWFELLAVNTLHLPFNTGTIFYIILLILSITAAIYFTYQDGKERLQNVFFLLTVGLLGIPFYGYGWSAALIGVIVLCALWVVLTWKSKQPLVSARLKNVILCSFLMIMIGYSSYAVIVIRSSANPPMDQNSPEDIFTLGTYLSREQYGDTPLLYGQAYTSEIEWEADGDYWKPARKKGAPIYQRKEKKSDTEPDSYFVVGTKDKYIYGQNMLFPRMYDNGKAASYESWMATPDPDYRPMFGGLINVPRWRYVPYEGPADKDQVKMPTQFENLYYFLSYQCNFMYWRYFMWNFAGRQNDIQSQGEVEHGNWVTGFKLIDNLLVGNQDLLPDELKENKGHNVYYCLPLLLGLLGLFWQAWRGQRGIRQFWVVFFLFFMTGLAIVLYLNQPPSQPRERDYAYAGSFYAYAIWCGLGVLALIDLIKKYLKIDHVAVAAVVAVACLLVPVQMASQNWDDHDRSDRYTCRDFGQNYLMSMQDAGNPIIFTNGDNDTFPLWYNHDVENFRTDTRVCNFSYLQTDWYIDQMRRPAYDSPGLPISWSRIDYESGTNEAIAVRPELKQELLDYYKQYPEEARKQFGDDPFDIKNIMRHWVLSGDQESRVIPTDTLYLAVDKEAVRKSGMMIPTEEIPDKMVVTLTGKRTVYKQDLMLLDMLANCNWTRPMYIAITVGEENYLNLGDNFIREGLVDRITPFTTKAEGVKNFDTEKTYQAVMNRFRYGGVKTRGIYLDETVRRLCYTHRQLMATLALELIKEGKDQKALAVLKKAEEELPSYNLPMQMMGGGLDMAKAYMLLGKTKEARALIEQLWKRDTQYLRWYLSLDANKFALSMSQCLREFYLLSMVNELADSLDPKLAEKQREQLLLLQTTYEQRGGSFDY